MIGDIDRLYREKLSRADFKRLGNLIESEYGIKMPPAKHEMLEARLRKRLKALNINNYKQYCDYVLSPEGRENELVHMIDTVSTNKTDFFREPAHFQFLVKDILPELISVKGAGVNRELVVWSCGCSTGEEPYTISMVLSEFKLRAPGLELQYIILATDVSTQVLDKAKRAVYTAEKSGPIPVILRQKYLMKSKDKNKGLIRIVPELRNHVRFRRLNLLDDYLGMREPLDIIFFRNVMIYFERDVQKRILQKIIACLRPGGYLFIGHSETLNKFDFPIHQVSPTIYKKEE
ncbi:MAG: chemotaxis protein CheR [bacterium]|nr:chemotaxis protein CheR [bacterium]